MLYIYLSAPMTGMKDFNRSLFEYGECLVKAEGNEALNPEKESRLYDERKGQPRGSDEYRVYMRMAVELLFNAHEIWVLGKRPWLSQGVRAEIELAKALSLNVVYIEAPEAA